MAIKLGIIGLPNTGKSFSRKSIKRGEDVFVIAPTRKGMHLTTSDGKPIQPFNLEFGEWKTTEAIMKAKGYSTIAQTLEQVMKSDKEVKVTGNWIICKKLKDLETYLKWVSLKMPLIKTIILPDFTHFISEVIADPAFIGRKAGGEAFQRLNTLY
jgi:hypothetical protein